MITSETSNPVLVRLLNEGDVEAFTEIYNRYWSLLYNAAYKRLRDQEQCQDIVQNVFINLWDRRGTLAIENLPAYLSSAVKFNVFKAVSKNSTNTEFFEIIESIATSPYKADGEIINAELQDLLEKLLNTLTESRRKIFVMHYQEELSTKDISKELGISQKTVQNQLNTATKELRLKLAQFLTLLLAFLQF